MGRIYATGCGERPHARGWGKQDPPERSSTAAIQEILKWSRCGCERVELDLPFCGALRLDGGCSQRENRKKDQWSIVTPITTSMHCFCVALPRRMEKFVPSSPKLAYTPRRPSSCRLDKVDIRPTQ
jgi:hypothetical protein